MQPSLEKIREALETGLAETLGVKLVGLRGEGLEAKVVVDARHLRPEGIANGGLNLALIETVGSISASCRIDYLNFNVLGLNVNANHLKTAGMGDVLTAVSKPVHIGRSTQIWDVEISNQDAAPVATGRITLLVVPRKRG